MTAARRLAAILAADVSAAAALWARTRRVWRDPARLHSPSLGGRGPLTRAGVTQGAAAWGESRRKKSARGQIGHPRPELSEGQINPRR